MEKSKPKIGKLIRITPGGRHAWYESDQGPVRKNIDKLDTTQTYEIPVINPTK